MFILTLNTDSAAFERSTEVAEILEDAAIQLRAGYSSHACYDYNGNRVGQWELSTTENEPDPEPEPFLSADILAYLQATTERLAMGLQYAYTGRMEGCSSSDWSDAASMLLDSYGTWDHLVNYEGRKALEKMRDHLVYEDETDDGINVRDLLLGL